MERDDAGELVAGEGAARWRARPVLAWVVRALVVLVPVAAGVAAAWLLVRLLPAPASWPALIGVWAAAFAAATVVVLGVERVARRALPLAGLLDLALLFPGPAPSRFRTALKAGSTRLLEQRTRQPGGDDEDTVEAAQQILAYAYALSSHDHATRGHSERVRALSEVIATELGVEGQDLDRLRWAALLHDVGKLAVPSTVLNKPDSPDEDEWERLHAHPEEGSRIVAPLLPWLGEWGDTIAHHHERWDGSGYPAGLAGDEIAWGARIVAVADAFETMTSGRSYADPMSVEEARQEVMANAGTQFDPEVARALLNVSVAKLERITVPLAWATTSPLLPSLAPSATTTTAASATVGATAVAIAVFGPPQAATPDTADRAAPPAATAPAGTADGGTVEDPGRAATGVDADPGPVEDTTSEERAGAQERAGAAELATSPAAGAPAGGDPAGETAPESTGPAEDAPPPDVADDGADPGGGAAGGAEDGADTGAESEDDGGDTSPPDTAAPAAGEPPMSDTAACVGEQLAEQDTPPSLDGCLPPGSGDDAAPRPQAPPADVPDTAPPGDTPGQGQPDDTPADPPPPSGGAPAIIPDRATPVDPPAPAPPGQSDSDGS